MSEQDDDGTRADQPRGDRNGNAPADEGPDGGGSARPQTSPSARDTPGLPVDPHASVTPAAPHGGTAANGADGDAGLTEFAMPELAVAEDGDIQLEEPRLGAAEISGDVAESTSLNEVEAEAARVAEEAQATGTMVAGNEFKAPPAPALPMGDAVGNGSGNGGAANIKQPAAPRAAAASADNERGTDKETAVRPDPTASPVAGSAWSKSAAVPDRPVSASPAATGAGSDKPAREAGQSGSAQGGPEPHGSGQRGTSQSWPGIPPAAGGTGNGGPGQPPSGWNGPADHDPANPGGPQGPHTGGNRRLYIMIGAAVIAVLVIIGAIWIIVSLLSGSGNQAATSSAAKTPLATQPASSTGAGTANPTSSAPASASATSTSSPSNGGLIAADVPPLKWAKGDCLKSFQSASQNADVVDCTIAHSAQLVGTYTYPASDKYPGLDALKAKATDTCDAVKLSAAANNYTYKPKSGYPSESTWAKGDRRVDCIIVDDAGDNIHESLLS